MSHFVMMVVTDKEPGDGSVLEDILMPWHEYECTGLVNEYVIDVDVTDEVEDAWNQKNDAYKLSNGEIISIYADEVWDSFSHKSVQPDGSTKIKVETYKLEKDKNKWANDYGDWSQKDDGKWYRYTNPNAKWDWWTIGGRYSGRLVDSRSGARCDSCQIKDLDIKAMKKFTSGSREKEIIEAIQNYPALDRDIIYKGLRNFAKAHAAWKELPDGSRPRGQEYMEWISDNYGMEAELVSKAWPWSSPNLKNHASLEDWYNESPFISCWGIIKDGKWFEKGDMGWWGMASNEMTDEEWSQKVTDMVMNLSEDKWITMIDCHI